ncbi:MAG: hypothetical protein LBO74_02265, partial [Candidatus Symbiothrix sp.]|nr:hypothetical protein [Candidatus Symbiothrix sp.]
NTANLGLLLPNVTLGTTPGEFVLVAGATELQKQEAKGMVVYYPGANLNGPGVYVWDGSEWVIVQDCTPPAQPTLTKTDATSINLTATTTITCGSVTGATSYIWTLPGGLSASNLTTTTNSITVTGSTAGTYDINQITVKAVNDCGVSDPATTGSGGGTIVVRTCSGVPEAPTLTRTGATTINRNATTTITCGSVTGATSYIWTLPGGLSASNLTTTTNVITVTGSTAGTYNINQITVKAGNDCGVSNPATTGSGGGTIVVRTCTGVLNPSLSFSVSQVASGGQFTVTATNQTGATYAWTYPSSVTVVSGLNTNQLTVQVGASVITDIDKSGFKVKATNECGTGATISGSGTIKNTSNPCTSSGRSIYVTQSGVNYYYCGVQTASACVNARRPAAAAVTSITAGKCQTSGWASGNNAQTYWFCSTPTCTDYQATCATFSVLSDTGETNCYLKD